MRYSPQGPAHDRRLSVIVRIFDAETGIEYEVRGYDPSLRGGNPAAAIAIARSLLPAAGAPPAAPPAPKRYDRLDATGAVATAGSWAILGADGGVLTAWEDLRGGAAALRVHRTDAGGVSRAAAWGAVEAGGPRRVAQGRRLLDPLPRRRRPRAPGVRLVPLGVPGGADDLRRHRRGLHRRRRGVHRLQRRRRTRRPSSRRPRSRRPSGTGRTWSTPPAGRARWRPRRGIRRRLPPRGERGERAAPAARPPRRHP